MRYTVLITKLLDAAIKYKDLGVSLSERLNQRYTSDIIRSMLMQIVCDERFQFLVGKGCNWKYKTKLELEDFAKSLEQNMPQTETAALNLTEEFLQQWFVDKLKALQLDNNERISLAYNKENISMSKEQVYNILSSIGFGEGDIPEMESESEYEEINAIGSGEGDKADMESEFENVLNNENKQKPEEPDSKENTKKQIGKTDSPYFQNVETRFLKKIPPSLLQLAKLIGRSQQDASYKMGKFLTASKSDIAGISIGNDLSCLLPSELAMLSEAKTRDIFYRNFATKQLQVFASASSSQTPCKKHQDGPIIICLDTSSSMCGEPIAVAKMLAMAVMIIAKRKNRPVLLVAYSYSYRMMEIRDFAMQKKEILDFLRTLDQSGNDENRMFRWLLNSYLPSQPTYKTADVLCISDFGWTEIHKDVMDSINKEKEKGCIFYGLNIGHEFYDLSNNKSQIITSLISPMDVLDSIWVYELGVCRCIKQTPNKK